ncbi:MAG: serine hydrolase [Gemmatimonadaceae bacterium]|nr:serine hydrolase [Gemmatimonadaceae bacterium]
MSHSPLLRLAGLAGACLTLSCVAPAAPGTVAPAAGPAVLQGVPVTLTGPLPAAATQWIDATVRAMPLRDRIGQMVMIWVLGDYTSTTDSSFAWARDRIVLDRVGGVVMSLGTPIEVAAKVNALQRLALGQHQRLPLLIAMDVEPGLGRLEGGTFTPGTLRGGDATVLPNNMAIGATGSVAHAREAGRIIGEESRAIGIHVAFAPAVDVNNNPANPVINVRSFGEDPHAVAALATAFITGVQSAGVAATVKHFPGHGDTDTDSHNALPVVSASVARLDTLELLPFRAGFQAGAAAVMSAHIALPAISHDSTPATLVPAIMQDLLRTTLRFGGLAFTDAMDMRGVGAGYGVEESSVRAIQSGADILLMPADVPAAIAAIGAAVERGEIPAARIEASVRRILEWKLRTGAIQRPVVDLDSLRVIVGSGPNRRAAQRIAEDAITLLRNDDRQLPLAAGGRTAIITFAAESDVQAGRTFGGELRGLLPQARLVRIAPSTPRQRLDSLLRPDERVVFATFVRTIEGEGRFSVGEHVARWLDSVAVARPVTVVAFSNPYVIREFAWVSGYVAAFGRGDAIERAAALAVGGRIPFRGHAPISLPGFFTTGAGTVTGVPDTARADLEDSLRAILARGVRDSVFPGAIALVGNRGGVVTEVSAGRIDWAADAPAPDARTVWDIASLTKVVGMTTAMMQLVEQGKVVLDAPVQRYLPEWTGRWKERVTVRHLLTHSAGLPAFRQLWKLTSSPDSARALLMATPLDTVPGARMVYSDIGAILAGWIVERVSGEPLAQYYERHIFGPLGMTDTRFLPPADWRPRIAPTERDPWRGRLLRGEVHDENAFFLGTPVAHAGLFSSGRDLARFAQLLLNEGALGGTRIVGAETVRDFTRVQNVLLSNRALGWETPTGGNSAGRWMKRPAYGHTGFTGTSIWIDPANDRFVVLLTNRVNPTRENSRIGPVRTAVADLVTTADLTAAAAAARAATSGPAGATPPQPQ